MTVRVWTLVGFATWTGTVVAHYGWGIPLESNSNRTCADTQLPGRSG
jgi:hypothetical protein